jgi:hypothetical protein
MWIILGLTEERGGGGEAVDVVLLGEQRHHTRWYGPKPVRDLC